jgi:hypothetical protein
MTDIVAGLRYAADNPVLISPFTLREAADEIERLHSERLAFAMESEERRVEIERLNAECLSGMEEIHQLRAEIERLRAALREIVGISEPGGPARDIYDTASIARRVLEQRAE